MSPAPTDRQRHGAAGSANGRHWIGPEHHPVFLAAWRRFETTRQTEQLLQAARDPIRNRCTAAARRLGLDPDELESEVYSVLILRKLGRHHAAPCVNDDHCVGLFAVYVDHAISDATRRLCRERAKTGRLQPLGDHRQSTRVSHSEALAEQEQRRYNVAQLRRCQNEALGEEEARAIELTHIAPVTVTQAEIALQLGLSVRGLRKRLRVAEKKLLYCLQRKGVQL